MRFGIDISQLAYPHTGVANYLYELVSHLLEHDSKNEYILFYSSLRQDLPVTFPDQPNVIIKRFKMPPKVLDFLWNRLHIIPIENLIGDVDIFITSDWTEPPTKKARKATIVYDVIVYKYPEETAKTIIETQKRKLRWVKKESDIVFCISKATMQDVHEILGIPKEKLCVIYPGIQSEV